MQLLVLTEDNHGGEGQATKSLLRAVADLRHASSQPLLIHHYRIPALQRTSLIGYLSWLLHTLLRSGILVWRHRQAEVFYTTSFLPALAAVWWRPWTGQRVCLHYHGNRLPVAVITDRSWWRRASHQLKYQLTKWLHHLSWPAVDVFLVPDASIVPTLQRAVTPVLGHRWQVVPNGVNAAQFHPVSSELKQRLRKQFHIPHRALVCGLFARLDPVKDFGSSLACIQAIQRHCRHQVLVLLAFPQAGSDPKYEQQLRQQLRQSELAHLFFGDFPKLNQLYQVCDCVISHSQQEVFPLTLLEAAATGIPFFTPATGSLATHLARLDPRLLLPATDDAAARHLLRVLHRYPAAAALRQFAVNHSWQASAAKLWHILSNNTAHR